MKRTYNIETTIELEVAIQFDYWPPSPGAQDHPPTEPEVAVQKVYLIYQPQKGKPDLTDSIEKATGWDDTLIAQLNQICLDHASFDQKETR